MERTFVMLKPDCVQRRLMGEVLRRIESKGLSIVAMKMLQVSSELSDQHYKDHVDKPFYPGLKSFITSSPAVALVVEGIEAINLVRKMLGVTNGREADPGTIRGDFGISQQMNLVHASDGPAAAEREIAIYFTDSELHAYTPADGPWLRYPGEGE